MVAPLPDLAPLPVDEALDLLPTIDEAELHLEAEWQARTYRRAQRECRRLGVRQQPRCRSCRRFKRGPALCEHCGYIDGVGHQEAA